MRALPSAALRQVGPFVFVDHFGPVQLPPGRGMDVRPHPHIGLATIAYLFQGRVMHRDSHGSAQVRARTGELDDTWAMIESYDVNDKHAHRYFENVPS